MDENYFNKPDSGKSGDFNQDILREATVFLQSMIKQMREQKELAGQHEVVRGMAYFPVKRTTYVDSLSRGLRGEIRVHEKDGSSKSIDVKEDETINEVLVRNDMDEGTVGTPVFSFPQIDDKYLLTLGIATAISGLGDVKFACYVSEAWASSNPEVAPSEDKNRHECIIGWCIVFDEKNESIIALLTTTQNFKFEKNKIVWGEETNDKSTKMKDIMKQPLVGKVIEKLPGFS
tara:strand:- start:726 stop:1421 length:696 start_codon:yes stop_codon:yes gene_type:complete